VSKLNRLLLPLFLVFATGALLLEKPWRGDAHQRTADQVEALFPELISNRQSIDKIEIDSDGILCTMQRNQNGFVILEKFNHPAADKRVITLVDELSRLSTKDIVSANFEKHQKFGVAEGQGTRIKIYAGEKLLADLIAGSLRSQDIRNSKQIALEFYLRDASSAEVLLVNNYSPPPTSPEDWLRVPLCKFDVGEIKLAERVDFRGNKNWTLARGDTPDRWQLLGPKPGPADSYQADSWIFSFSNLEAADVVANLGTGTRPAAEYGFTTDLFRAENDLAESCELQLGGVAPNNRRYAWIPGSDWVYAIDEFEADQLRLNLDTDPN